MKTDHRQGLASLALALVAGCGGRSGGSAPPPAPPAPTVTALDDQYTVPAGAAAVLAVSGNDTVTGGTATLSVATAPAHGKVVVQGSSLQYTPDAGFFGDDQFTYRADVGAASSTATVKVNVEAEIELSGTVPGINSLTEVTAQVGEASYKVTADDAGAYKLSFKTGKPSALITLTAKESGVRAAYTRTSLVGDAGSLYAQAGTRINATQWPALVLDALSTARHGLLKQRGPQPATTSELKAAAAAQDPNDLLDITTLLRHAYEDGATLPSGATTATELAASPAALAAFNQQWVGGSVTYPALVEKTLAQVAAAAAPTVAATGSRLATLYEGSSNVVMPTGSVFDLRADGSATGIVWTFSTNTAINASWATAGNTLTVTLASPVLMDGQYRVYAQQYKQVRGIDGQASRQLMTRWLADCPATTAFCPVAGYTVWVPVVSYDVERDRQPLRLEDFAVGTTWAGIDLTSSAGVAQCMCSVQAVVTDGTPNLPGYKGQLTDGRWVLSGTETTFRYTRLGNGPEPGMEYWLTEYLESGTPTRANLRLVAKGGPVPTFTTAGAARRWVTSYQTGIGSADPAGARYNSYPQILHADGRITYDFGSGEVDRGDRWFLSSDKRSVMQLTAGNPVAYVMYAPVRAVTGGYLAMSSSGGLVRMRDFGPAD